MTRPIARHRAQFVWSSMPPTRAVGRFLPIPLALFLLSACSPGMVDSSQLSTIKPSIAFIPPAPVDPNQGASPFSTQANGPFGGNLSAGRCGDGICQAQETCSVCARDCLQVDGQACPRVGIMYSVWHAPASFAMRNLAAAQLPQLTVSQLLQEEASASSGAPANLASMLATPGQVGVAANFYYQHVPQPGFYCIYSQRKPGMLHYNADLEGTYYNQHGAPDCPEADSILRQHARQLVQAGIDYVVVDMTSIGDYTGAGDLLQLRPFEVLLSTWAAMRANGEATPDVAAWQRLADGAAPAHGADPNALSTYVLDLYRQSAYAGLLLRTAPTGKAVFFYPTAMPPDRSRVAEVALNGGQNDVLPVPMWTSQTRTGVWSFMEACRNYPVRGIQPVSGACGQDYVQISILGSQMAISPSYQIGYASTAGEAIGHYRGYVLRQQFASAWSARPAWLLLSSWNEHIAQPQAGPLPDMGLERDTSLTSSAFVDTYGVEFSRDLEPTAEEGSLLYDLMASCLRIYRRGLSSCSVPQELCCQQPDIGQIVQFHGTAGAQFGYYPTTAAAPAASRALYACSGSDGAALSTTAAGCTAFPKAGGASSAAPILLGAIASTLGPETLRQLWTCQGAAGVGYTLSLVCAPGSTRTTFLGYVR